MNVNGEYRLPASRERVWEALHDPETLRACIPGGESVEQLAEGIYAIRLGAQVGAVSTTFSGRITLSEQDFPRNWTISAHLESGAAGFAEGMATVTLTAEGDYTVLGYRARIEPGGRLASVGSRLLHGVAIRMANEFFVRVIERVKPQKAGDAPQELAESVPVSKPARVLNPIAPTAVSTPGPKSPGHPGRPAPEANATRDLPYQGEVNPRTQWRIIVGGWVVFIFLMLVMFWPRP